MIKPEDFAVGGFVEASGLVLMLPRSDRDEPILISEAGGEKMAICLGQHKYDA